jgi:dipeptidyl aminopeptidase/acylaminoacyl peptidase
VLSAPDAVAKRKNEGRDRPESVSTVVERWLVLGPVPHPLPVFHDADKGGYELKQLLEDPILPDVRFRPRDGDGMEWLGGASLAWTSRQAHPKGGLSLEVSDSETPAVAWLAVYLSVERWSAFDLELLGYHPRRAWLDGEEIASGKEGGDDDEVKGKVKLTTGKHLLLVETVYDPQREEAWSVGAALSVDGEQTPAVSFSIDPERPVNLADIIDPPRIQSLATAPDGSQVVAGVQRTVPGTGDSESWLEVRRTSDGSLAESWRGSLDARSVAWSPDGRFISYVSEAPGKGEEKSSTLYLYDRDAGRVSPLLESVKELGSYLWSPTGHAIVYATTLKAEEDKRGVKLVEGLADRWADYRDKQYLHLVAVPGGARRRLTAGALSTDALAFSADGKRLLFSRRVEDLTHRPYSRTELWELNLESFAARKLRDFNWFNGAEYAPDGERILIAADATAFGDAGLDLPEGITPNSYDGQLFIWNPATEEVDAITREFDPAVLSFWWSRHNDTIYVTAEDRDFVRLYRHYPRSNNFLALDTGYDMIRGVDLAAGAPLAVGLASSAWNSQALVAVELATGRSRTLDHPADEWFSNITRGTLREFDFIATSGQTVPGRVYLPQGFDASRRYPAIVYYYGGTSPVGRDFGGRYPKEWWASNGYVVYVLQPTGATGYGQAGSATHVNDWGIVTSKEIIEGTRAFLEAHAFVDPDRVGCIGASYGGFMTMLLTTQTDLFAAAVSHAGISSLASYWGEGYWGALYSAVATADSFPWNRKDLYVDQSALFRADQNRVPILLTHGTADTNVPPGESDQFFVALKLLGKNVEYLQVDGQNHFIMEHDKRVVWSSSIMAWFDRWLKDQPEWWNDLHPSRAVETE